MDVVANIKKVQERVNKACQRSGRNPKNVKILPVSKTHPEKTIQQLYDEGWHSFGEDYVQELRRKQNDLPKDINWYMIGHLQRNKVKYIAKYITEITSVDSVKLLQTIEKEGKKANRIIPALIEVNGGQEASKFGVKPNIDDCLALANKALALPHVKIKGLMTMAPHFSDPEKTRPVFRNLRQLENEMNQQNKGLHLTELSMGMTNDFEIAVEEGSTCVRVGTAIFGPRNYSKRGY